MVNENRNRRKKKSAANGEPEQHEVKQQEIKSRDKTSIQFAIQVLQL